MVAAVRSLAAPTEAPSVPSAPFPLSIRQTPLWWQAALSPDKQPWVDPFALQLQSEIDPAALRRAFEALVQRHPQLRTTFGGTSARPSQQIQPTVPLELEPVDGRAWDAARLDAYLRAQVALRWDLAKGPPFRVRAIAQAEGRTLLWMAAPHLIWDGWSQSLLVRELLTLLGASSAPLPPPTATYGDFVAREARLLSGPEGQAHAAFWQTHLDGAPLVLDLPSDRPRPTQRGPAPTAILDVPLPPDLAPRIAALAQREGTTVFAVLLTALQSVLHEVSGQDDLLIGASVAARPLGFERTVGYFQNLLPLRSRARPGTPLRALLHAARDQLAQVMQHQDHPYPSVVEKLKVPRHPTRPPAIQVAINHQRTRLLGEHAADEVTVADGQGFSAQVGGIRGEFRRPSHQHSLFDLELLTLEGGGQLFPRILYSAALFDAPRIAGLADRLRDALERLAAREG